MPDYLFVLVVTIVMGLLPTILGLLTCFVHWEKCLDKYDIWFLIRLGVITAILGFVGSMAQIYLG